jgi:uncharacterized protein (TIGR02996 family)
MAGEELDVEKVIGSSPESALSPLLDAWRGCFDPALGRLIEHLGASLATPLEGLPAKKGERAAMLATLARECSDGQRSAVLAAFEDFARDAAGRLVWPSIEAWAEINPDPRVARMALRVLTAVAHGLTAKVWRRLVNCIEQHGDLGVVEDARAYEATLRKQSADWGFSPERFSNVLKKLGKSRRCVLPAEAAAVERMLSQVGPPVASGPVTLDDASAMLAAIVARPDDDGPRLVYADWLTERRHPAGEFIVLQISRSRGKATAAARAREAELLATHRKALLGPFDGAVAKSGLRFERGFLVSARFTEEVPLHPLTRLLRSVDFDEGFAKGARFDALEAAKGPGPTQRDALPLIAPKLAHWDVEGSDWKSLRASLQPLRLETLTLRGLKDPRLETMLSEFFSSPAASTLRSLELHVDGPSGSQLALDGAPASLTSISVHRHDQQVAGFKRDRTGWSDPHTDELIATLEAPQNQGERFEALRAELMLKLTRRPMHEGVLPLLIRRLQGESARGRCSVYALLSHFDDERASRALVGAFEADEANAPFISTVIWRERRHVDRLIARLLETWTHNPPMARRIVTLLREEFIEIRAGQLHGAPEELVAALSARSGSRA